ncbi:hypothetical protein RQP53_09710 [Paucibacter sp. APW11]|uniref:TonB C-terminal domain-containing protein n=1 Tax=Roseateles aquae TaxID=3077235 RepID=A0ABU3PAJ7_9BURK|nr:hypothetical protein [Paucibacter sp. APW11]MDT8999542.1 hypothetical protein [Paucibacter sp. APW11]
MNHPSKKQGFERIVAVLGLAVALGTCAHAQTQDVSPPSPAHALSCLQRPERAPQYPSKHSYDNTPGFMRLQLQFAKPDEGPTVRVLSNTAREDMQDVVMRYVERYRLPCLTPTDGIVSAVQEFSFSNSDLAPLPYDEEGARRPAFCIVMPRKDVEPPSMLGNSVSHIVATAAFSGDGESPPEVKIIHSSGTGAMEALVRERLAEYRMPCRHAGDAPQAMRQQFTFVPAGVRRYVLKRQAFGLAEFLGMTTDARQLQADFDFNTMNCPFKLHYSIYGPALPNEVRASGKKDPNRVAFLHWMKARQLAFASDRQANDMFGQTVQIDVPCGRLNLQPQPSPN